MVDARVNPSWVYDDGGRSECYKGVTGDCVVRAISIVTGRPYQEIYDAVWEEAKLSRLKRDRSSPRNGVATKVTRRYMESIGWEWLPTMGIGSGCTTHLKSSELPAGRIMARCSKHIVAVVDGVVHDIYDSTREGTRCVYGYWRKPS